MIFRYTILYVADVPATLAFYNAAFAIPTAFLHEGGDYGELLTGQTKLAFSSHALMAQIGKTVARRPLWPPRSNWPLKPMMSPPRWPAP
jgi:lactoylglutathione lyase